MELRPGERFDRYMIDRLIAETRMSKVWVARDMEENARLLALKVVRRLAENDDIVEAARFGAMLQQLLSAQDEHVVKVYRYGETCGWFFIDMEHIQGKDVSEVLREQGRIAPDKAVRIAIEVARTLDNLHNFSTAIEGRQVISAVHGDLKPKNIRLTGGLDSDFSVKVLDFGTAKALSQGKPGGTHTPAWSPAYASPELLERREMNPLSDRWALGITLYEMATGHVPFGAGKSIEEIETQIRFRPRMPDLEVQDCPGALPAVLYKLLDPDPASRYQSARELLLDLERYPEMPAVAGYQGETVRSDAPVPESGDETRRSPNEPVRKPAAAAQPALRPAVPNARATLIRALVVLLSFALVFWLIARQGRAYSAARKLASDLSVGKISVTAAREQYEELRDRHLVWIPTREIDRLLGTGFIARGDAIMTRFRSSGVKIAEWRQARAYFVQAHDSRLGDEALAGRLRLCDAHLLRYQAQAEKAPELFERAAAQFREAGRMLRESPDPWLGLAMLEIYNRKDPDKGEQALEEARRRSYDYTGETRWVALLADAYRARADLLDWEAQQIVRTLPDGAVERLEHAAADNEKAVEWYSRIPLFGSSLRDIERCRKAIDRINMRLEKLRSGDIGSL